MTLDPFTSLGLASNIIQFVDFATKLIGESRTIYKSASDAGKDNLVLQAVTNDLSRLTNSIVTSNNFSDDLRKLANETRSISAELSDVLEKLRSKRSKTRWNSFIVAIREAWSQDKINSTSSRLSRLQAQVNTHLLVEIR
jgi:ABC-type transporter Mla subunit MlaD